MKKRKYIIIVVAIVFLAIVAVFTVFALHHNEHKEIENEFPITNPWRQNIEIQKEYVAQINASQHIELRSFEKGYLQNIYVDEGQLIKKGQKMFQIMPLLLEAELKKVKAEYQLIKIEYNNTLMLQKRKVVSKNELALAKAKLDKAEAEMEMAQTHLEFTTIKAPFDGIMDRFHVRLGSLIDEGELLTTLSDNSIMWVYFNVSESDYLDYMKHEQKSKKTPVQLRLADNSLFEYEGVVDTIEADFNNEVGNVAFRASFANPDNLLRHGETGNIILTKKTENALVIPQKATFEVLDKKFVYLVNEENEVYSKEVQIAEEIEHLFIIKEGNIKENDKILLEGFGKIHVDEEIKTYFQNKEQVLQSLDLSVEANIENSEIIH